MTSFKKKDPVFIPSLKKFGEVLGEKKPGTIEVVVGSMVLQCRAEDLQLVQHKKSSGAKARPEPTKSRAVAPNTRRAAEKLDLHGLRVEEAMRRVENAIDRAILADVDRLEIVHGLGTGKIRRALHIYLNGLSVVASYKIDDANAGVTLVYF